MPVVEEFYQKITLKPCTVNPQDSIETVRQKIIKGDPSNRSVYVVDDNFKLLGVITVREIINVLSVRKGISKSANYSKGKLLGYVSRDTAANEIMRSPISVRKEDSLEVALELFITHNLEELPVIDINGILIGDLDAYEILQEINEE